MEDRLYRLTFLALSCASSSMTLRISRMEPSVKVYFFMSREKVSSTLPTWQPARSSSFSTSCSGTGATAIFIRSFSTVFRSVLA